LVTKLFLYLIVEVEIKYIKVKINYRTEIDILVLFILMNGLKIFIIFKESSELFDKI